MALHEAMLARGLESPYAEWLEELGADRDERDRITTRVPCARLLRGPRPGAARARHPDRPRRRLVPRARSRSSSEVWPTEDFELAQSHGRRSSLPEDDLFAGLALPWQAADAMATSGDLPIAYDGRKDPS